MKKEIFGIPIFEDEVDLDRIILPDVELEGTCLLYTSDAADEP